MKRILFGILAFSLLLSACASPAIAPSPTPDIPATTESITGTMVASTLTAQPTATQPPTQTPQPPTETATSLPLASETPTPTETATSIPFVGTLAPGGIDNVKIGFFLLENNTASSANVSINGYTEPGNKPVFIAYDVKANGTFPFTIPYGTYQYVVFVGNKMFNGEFRINNEDKTTMRISMKKVIVVGP